MLRYNKNKNAGDEGYGETGGGNTGFHPYFTNQNPYGTPEYYQDPNNPVGGVLTLGLNYDVFERGEELIVEIPFPGLRRESLTVTQERCWIRVQGEAWGYHEEDPSGPQKVLLYSQNPKGYFDQTICLPCEVEDTFASYKDGVVTITMRKAVTKDTHQVPVEFV